MKNKLSKLLLTVTTDKKLVESIVNNIADEISYEQIESIVSAKRKLEREIIDMEQSINLNASNAKMIMTALFNKQYSLILLNQKLERILTIYDLYFSKLANREIEV